MQLVIVESPTKAKTISRFLGSDFIIKSSFGHIRYLPQKNHGLDIEHDFVPDYVIPTKSRKTVRELKKAAEGADTIILATDPDREGEAIAWHLAYALGLNKKTPASPRLGRGRAIYNFQILKDKRLILSFQIKFSYDNAQKVPPARNHPA